MVETVFFLNFLETIGVLATLIFVLTIMLGMDFSLTVQQILIPERQEAGYLLAGSQFCTCSAARSWSIVYFPAFRNIFHRAFLS